MVAEETAAVDLVEAVVTAIVVRSGAMARVAEEATLAEMETIADRSLPAAMTTVVEPLEARVAVWTVDSNRVVVVERSDRAVDAMVDEMGDSDRVAAMDWEDLAEATMAAAFVLKMEPVRVGTVRAMPRLAKTDTLQAFHRPLPSANLRRRLEVHHHRPDSALRLRHRELS